MADIEDDEASTKRRKTNWDKLDPQIEYTGRHLTLPGDPERMPLRKAIEALERKEADEQQPFKVYEIIEGFPHDGAVAFVRAMTELYGWASPQTVMTFFGPKPPVMMSIKTGPAVDDVVQCPIGAFKLPGVDELVHTKFIPQGNGILQFAVISELKKKDKHILLNLATRARELVREKSIYRGKPIRLASNPDGSVNFGNPPEFMDVSEMSEESILFDQDIRDQIEVNVLTPIRHTAECRKLGIPLKRGVLLEGPYGTGKSLTARLAARIAELHGWTFILIDRVQSLRVALEFANRYAPAVVFAEDVDRMVSERSEEANDLVNIIDGVVSKRTEVMTILTTNFVEKLDPVILRPGRLDAVISIRAPGPLTVQRLIRHYAVGLIDVEESLNGAGAELAGQIPASIRECTERAKLAMVSRGGTSLCDDDLLIMAKGMKSHLALLNHKKDEPSDAEKLAASLRKIINPDVTSLENRLDELDGGVANGANWARRAHDEAAEVHETIKTAILHQTPGAKKASR